MSASVCLWTASAQWDRQKTTEGVLDSEEKLHVFTARTHACI